MTTPFEAAEAHEPRSLAEAARAMEQLAREGKRVAFLGGGTELELGPWPERIDAVVRTRGLGRIVEYQPADMVMVVEAGLTMGEMQAAAREHRQRLALDPPWPERATIGGIVATGAFGPRRARYGAVRDLIIGVQLVRADGAVAHGGGKVVKNVAGFDLPKVACSSLGTLGLIASATFRLHPLPEASETVEVPGLSAAEVVAMVSRIRAAQLEPAAAAALRGPSGYDLALCFEGFGKGVEQQIGKLRQLAPSARAEEGAWARHDEVRTGGPLRIKVASLPTQLPEVDRLVSPLGLRFAWYPTLGLGFASGAAGEQAAALIADARAELLRRGGSLVVQAAPAGLRVDRWGPPPPSFPVMQRVKQNFDPDRRLNPGRFVGGL
ncbi:MAG TPA: FAD-binding oxidoreductase [Myxococcales bacterium]